MNILSKIDLISKYGNVEYDLDYYTELPDMTRMLYGVDRFVLCVRLTLERTGIWTRAFLTTKMPVMRRCL